MKSSGGCSSATCLRRGRCCGASSSTDWNAGHLRPPGCEGIGSSVRPRTEASWSATRGPTAVVAPTGIVRRWATTCNLRFGASPSARSDGASLPAAAQDSRLVGPAGEGLGASRSDVEVGGGYHPIPPPGPIPAPRTTPPVAACRAAGSCRPCAAPHGRYSRHCVQTLMTVEALMSSRAISHFASVSNGPNCVNATGPPGANS